MREELLDDHALMCRHVEALFVHDADGRLTTVNEPGGKPAPRFFLGRTRGANVVRHRSDLARDVVARLERLARVEPIAADLVDRDDPDGDYAGVFESQDSVRRWSGPAFRFPASLAGVGRTVHLTGCSDALLHPELHDWLPDISDCPPCVGVVVGGKVAAICGSVRITEQAHEAGVETAMCTRRQGLAREVVAGWAHAVRALGCVPLYSTSWDNAASLGVARSLGLVQLGSDFHLT